ncbi:MAG: YlbF family regulator [Bacillota bacterium]
MNALDEKTRKFIEQIKSTGEFRRLKQSRDALARDPELKNKIIRFNQVQADLYSLPEIPQRDKERKLTELNSQFESLSKVPEVAEYLEHYKRFNEFMMEINKTITVSLEEDLGFK